MADDELSNLTAEELRDLKTQYNKAKDLLEKINALSIRYDAAFKAFETRTIDVDKISSDVREKAVSIENVRTESVRSLDDIKTSLEKIQSSIAQVEEAAIKFEGTKGRIEGKEGEMDELLSTARSLRGDVEKAKNDAQQKLVEIDNQFAKIKEEIAQMQKAYEAFIAVHAKITDSKTGLEAILDQSGELQRQSNETLNEIKSFHEQSKKYLEQSKVNKLETDKIKTEARHSLDEINANKSEVEKITALITDTGFANAFQKREKMLRLSAGLWLIVLIVSLALLAYYLHTSFLNLQGVPDWRIIIYRLTLTSPLLLLVGVAVRQYSIERSLNEKYAFKATVAAVIRAHSEFLATLKEKASREDVAYIREALKRVYMEPYKVEIDVKDWKKELREIVEGKDTRKSLGITQIFEKAKELKELIPDDALLRSVTDLLIKLR